jgi:putative photosynthetic complex assembly protein
MSQVSTPQSFPRGALIGAGALVAFALAIAATGRLRGPDLSMQQAPEVMHRDIRFVDGVGGSVDVFNADSGEKIDVISPGTGNFLRATIRGLTQQRKREAFGPSTPFRLTRWADGRLTLADPTTERKVELEAFGQTNEETFARLLSTNGAVQ